MPLYSTLASDVKWVLALLYLGTTIVLVARLALGGNRSESTAQKLIGKDIGIDEPLDIGVTLTMAFRLVSVGAGLLCLRTLLYIFSNIVISLLLSADFETFRRGSFTMDLVRPALYIALSVYLLCGAPHFVRWQVKKTLKFCEEK